MGRVARVEVVEYTDVMCSWAWGSEPKLRLLRWRYEGQCDWRLVMGGLVGDRTKNPAWDPVGPVPKTIAFWAQVTVHTGAPYPVHLKWIASCSDASGIGLCAARLQGDDVALAVLRRLREAIFVFGCTDSFANIHGPNERVLIDEWEKAVLAETLFFGELAGRVT